MCGITGELNFGGRVETEDLQGMTAALAHRGPDDAGYYCEGKIGLGHRRLSIIDLSPGGHQPMWTEDRTLAIVFNGEIYNHREIRPALEAKGYRFVGHSDTEVALNAVHCWGLEAALRRFIGMFAFGLWNARSRELLLVRDRLGIKPLYYQRSAQRLIFGSELRALYAHRSFRRELRGQGVGQFFCYGYTLGETTVWQDTHKLPAGHYLRVGENGATSLSRYWSLDEVERGSFRGTFEDAAEALVELCDSAFAYRLVSDVPVGVFLSGGIDSSFLAAFLQRRLGADLQHITIGFTDPAYNEAPKASQVAGALGLRHTVHTIDAAAAQEELLRFPEIWDEPFGDTSGLPTAMLCRFARRQVKVALSADGGDELFCGYDSYPAYAGRYRRLQRMPRPLRQGALAALRRLPHRGLISAALAFRCGSSWNPQTLARYEKAVGLLAIDGPQDLIRMMNEKGWGAGQVAGLLNLDPGGVTAGTIFDFRPRGTEEGDLIDHMMRTDLSAFLGEDILTKVDRASMASSLECRDPLLDHRLVEFAYSLPLDFLRGPEGQKRLLKRVMAPWIPPAVLSAPKRGFSIPLYDWMRGPWRGLVDEYLSPAKLRRVGVLNEKSALREIDDFYRHRGGRAERIMLMLNFQMWAERWL